MSTSSVIGSLFVLLALVSAAGCGADEGPAPGGAAGKLAPSPAHARSAPQAPVRPLAPSTGKEMPVHRPAALSPAEAEKLVASAMVEMKKPRQARDCGQVVDDLVRAVAALKLEANGKTAPVFAALTRCARSAKRFELLRSISMSARRMNQPIGRTSDLAVALIGLERYGEAKKELAAQIARTPADPALWAAAALLACKVDDYASCRKTAEKVIAMTRRRPDQDGQVARAEAGVLAAVSAAMLGDYRGARKLIGGMPEVPALDQLRKLVARAEMSELMIDPNIQRELSLGTYHLAGRVNRHQVELVLGNGSRRDRALRVEVEVPGVTSRATKSTILLAGKRERVALTPPLLTGYDVAALRAMQVAGLSVKVVDEKSGASLFDNSFDVEIYPRDYLPTYQTIGKDSRRPVWHNMGAWVTSNDPAIDALLTAAKKRTRAGFAGEQRATVPQAQAIFDELKARGVSYVMDPDIGSDRFSGQRTRLPAEVLSSTNAQCLEGTLLFASLLEAIGLRPVLVRVPRHIYVGWHAVAADGVPAGALIYLETTLVGSATFKQAVSHAMDDFKQREKDGSIESGDVEVLELADLRKRGVTAQPRLTGVSR